jgi:hypothetical protein
LLASCWLVCSLSKLVDVTRIGGGDSLGLASDVSLRLEILQEDSVESTSLGMGRADNPELVDDVVVLVTVIATLLAVAEVEVMNLLLWWCLNRGCRAFIPWDRACTSQSVVRVPLLDPIWYLAKPFLLLRWTVAGRRNSGEFLATRTDISFVWLFFVCKSMLRAISL